MKKRIINFHRIVQARAYFDLGHAAVYHFKVNDVWYVIISSENPKTIAVITTQDKFDAFLLPNRTYIQDIFPELTGMERQFIQSGYFFGKFDGQSFAKMEETIKATAHA